MKKFRGQHRYYANLRNTIENLTLDLDVNEWYNLWHFHIDFRGYSKYGVKHHRKHILLLLELFQRVLWHAKDFPQPYQTWVYINTENGMQDALYFHTQNPYTEFPLNFPEIIWGNNIPDLPPANFLNRIKRISNFGTEIL